MLFNFGLKSSLLLVFFIHGIVFSVLLFIKGIQHENKPSLWLSAFILLCALYISPFMLGYAGWYASLPYRDVLFYTPFQQLFLLPPLLFFYTQSLLYKSFVFSRKHLVHFIPAILYGMYSIVVFITDKLVLHDYYFYSDGRDKDLSPWYQVAGFIWMACYLVLSLRSYFQYKRITYQTASFADSVMFRWIERFLVAFLVLLLLRGLFFIINPEWAEFGRKFWYYLSFSILFYYISISGYVNSVHSFTPLPAPEIPADIKITPDDIEDLEDWKMKAGRLMTADKAFENPALTIAEVSQKLNLPVKKVSQIINQGFGMNFNDFVNYYRTQEVIKKMQSGEHNLQTLLGIAFDCGFNSKSTFNRAFKKHTSLTPREYLEKNHPE